jgi:rhomboid protease GluP
MLSFSRSPVTTTLLVAIGAVFAFEWVNGALLESSDALVTMGAIIPGLLERHEYWRLVAAMFLHANVLHVATNAWALYQLGSLYESMFGSWRFAGIYVAAGICASIASAVRIDIMFSSQHIAGASVGASGAIFGILGAFIFSIRRSPQWRHQPWTKGLISQLVFMMMINLVLGFSIKMIDNTAHIAGLVVGLLLGFLPHRVPPPPPSQTIVDVQSYPDRM